MASKFDSHVSRFRKQIAVTPEMIAFAVASIDTAAETAVTSDIIDHHTQLDSWLSIDHDVVLEQSLLTVDVPENDQKGTEETNLCVLSPDTTIEPVAAAGGTSLMM